MRQTIDTTPQYWNRRAGKRGKVAVSRLGYTPAQMEEVTDEWWKIIRPYFVSAGRVLEVGCGWGRWAEKISSVLLETTYTGVDVSERLVSMSDEAHDVRLCTPGSMPFGDDSFDTVATITVLQHLTEAMATRTAAEMARVLAPGGRVILVEGIDPGYRTRDGYADLFAPHLDIMCVDTFREQSDLMGIFMSQEKTP